ncbi:hypothetical protein [Cereibacter changlensis]|nr:hypothetical protein [Cereibacter changlensis]
MPRHIATSLGPVEIALDPAASGSAVLALHGGLGGWDQSALFARAVLGP